MITIIFIVIIMAVVGFFFLVFLNGDHFVVGGKKKPTRNACRKENRDENKGGIGCVMNMSLSIDLVIAGGQPALLLPHPRAPTSQKSNFHKRPTPASAASQLRPTMYEFVY